MTNSWNPFRRLFKAVHPIPEGMYHYQAPLDDSRNYRLHLRVDTGGNGILIINASTILHLNQTATEYAYYLIQNEPVDEVVKKMATRYQVDPQNARNDYLDLTERIQLLINTPDLDPVTFLDFELQQPFSGGLSAPYRVDCALTYQLPSDTPIEDAPIERVARELNTDEWMKILDKTWEAGIPHVVFTGGEATLRNDLPDLIAYAEKNGQISGLLTDGFKLVDKIYLQKLLGTGLDHIMILLQPDRESSWKAVENTMVEDLSVAVHLTITHANQSQASTILEKLSNIGVKQISLSIEDNTLSASLQAAREKAASLHLDLVWNLPVPYSSMHPVALEMGDGFIEGAGAAWLYIEPDGDVCAAQGAPKVLGNLLHDPWESIWKGSPYQPS